jgi:hypothetical protein
MTMQSAGSPGPEQLLFTPGPRLGWTFRSRRDQITPYSEPPPELELVRQQAAARLTDAQQSWNRARKWGLRPSLVVAIVLIALAGCAHAINGNAPLGTTIITAIVLAAPGTGWAIWRRMQLNLAKDADPQRLYDASHQAWQERAAGWERDELARMGDVPEWVSAQSPSGHTDVFGGTLGGWDALVTVHGTSILAARPLLVADLTGHGVANEMAGLARDAGADVAEYLLPRDLGGLLTELSPRQFADAFAEAIHAGSPGVARTDRAVDVRVMEQLADALAAGGMTPARLAGGVQAALGHPVPPNLLKFGEAELIQGTLFGDSYRGQIGPSLVRLDAFLADLARDGSSGWDRPPRLAHCTVLAADPDSRSARAELTSALVIQWLTTQVALAGADGPAIVVAGADQVTGHHLERLTDTCDSHGVPVTLLFRHLREDAVGVIGSGATAFMRLGNHREAEQAASFIGRNHRFVLSSFTATRAGSQSLTRGTSQTWGGGETRGSRSRDFSRNETHSAQESRTEGTNWSDADTRARVYEYAVEPMVLQNLPDNALLLVTRAARTGMQSVECHPAIVTLPGVSMTPAPPLADHQPADPPDVVPSDVDPPVAVPPATVPPATVPPATVPPATVPPADHQPAEPSARPNWWETGDSWDRPR